MSTQHPENPHQTVLQWTSHPLVENPKKGFLASFLVCFFVWLFHLIYQDYIITAIALIFLTGSLHRFFFPTTFTLTETEIVIQGLIFAHRRPWRMFRRVDAFDDSALLSTFEHPSRLDPYRGMHLHFSQNRDEVLAVLKDKIGFIRIKQDGDIRVEKAEPTSGA